MRTEPSGAEPGDGHRAPQPRSRYQPAWWALAFAAVTTAVLGLLAWGLLVMHALTYGAAAVVGPESIAAPDGDRYRVGFAVAAVVNLVSAPALAGLACPSSERTWPPIVQGVAAASSQPSLPAPCC